MIDSNVSILFFQKCDIFTNIDFMISSIVIRNCLGRTDSVLVDKRKEEKRWDISIL